MKRKPAPLRCSACDSKIEARWNYCAYCGFALNSKQR